MICPVKEKKLSLKTSQAKTIDNVEKMLFDLKVKTEGPFTSAARTISRNEKEIVYEKAQILIRYLLFLLTRFLMMIY